MFLRKLIEPQDFYEQQQRNDLDTMIKPPAKNTTINAEICPLLRVDKVMALLWGKQVART